MKRQGMTINEAAHEWVREFNAIQWGIIDKLMALDPDEWHEVTVKSVGDRVYCYESGKCGEITAYDVETEMYTVQLDNGDEVQIEESDMEADNYTTLPMWGTMWSFGDSADDWWLSDGNGIRIMSQCGFRIYEHEEFGYFFGIDGAGYDFYEAHWIPLYKARGLRWHDERTEISDESIRDQLQYVGGKEYVDLIEKIISLDVDETLNVGGYYGGCLNKNMVKAIEQSQKFSIVQRHEKVMEMNGHYNDNDYYVITREVR